MGKYFGTDGFRGEANCNLTADHAFKVGRFLGWYYNIKRPAGRTEPARILIGKDTRRSSYMFEYSLVGGLVATLNFFFMVVGLSAAADRAQNQDAKGGKGLVQGSYFIRILVMFVVLFACAKSGYFNVIALVVPLLFVRPALTVAEFILKKGE